MVGDEDRRRWARVRSYNQAARSLEEKALGERIPQSERRRLLDRSKALYEQAHALTL